MEETVKFEVPQIQLSGKYKIQLFDKDTGEKIQEIEKHNVISKIPFSVAFHNNIYRGFIYNDNAIGVTGTDVNSSNRWYSGYINWLMLTNDPEAPENDDKNPVAFGEMIGYAKYDDNINYPDEKRGIFNQNETTKIENKFDGGTKIKSLTRHIVWDFATDKGNGTFDNIYLVPNPNSNSIPNPNEFRGEADYFDSIILSNEGDYSYDDKSSYVYYQGDVGPISHSNTDIYMQCLFYKKDGKSQHWDKVAKLNLSNWKKDYITLSVPEERKNNAAYIIYATGFLWRIEWDYTVTRYNLDGSYKDLINIKSKFSNSDALNLYGEKSFLGYKDYYNNRKYFKIGSYDSFSGDDENLYISYIVKKTDKDNKVSYETYLCSLNNQGNVINEVIISKLENKKNTCANVNLTYINGEKYLICLSPDNSRESKIFKVKNGVLNEKNPDLLKALLKTGNSFFYSKEGLLFTVNSGDSGLNKSLDVSTLIPWSSHCKLSKPVTKTSTNTMKIQYDVTVDYIMPGMIGNLK